MQQGNLLESILLVAQPRLLGWRPSTIDVDIKLVPEANSILMALPQLKEQLRINIELAAPDDFIPELPGWHERSPFIVREGTIDFFHYDFYSQALSKIERDHTLDRQDVRTMIASGLVKPDRLLQLFPISSRSYTDIRQLTHLPFVEPWKKW